MDYAKIKQYAADTYRYARNSDERMVEPFKNYLKEGLELPCVAELLYSNKQAGMLNKYSDEMVQGAAVYGTKPINEYLQKIFEALQNIKKMKKDPELKPILDEFQAKYNELYPKTGKLRKLIIGQERIATDTIQHNEKLNLNWFQKLFL